MLSANVGLQTADNRYQISQYNAVYCFVNGHACSPYSITTSDGHATSKDAGAAGPRHMCMYEWSSEAADPRSVSPLIVLQHDCR